MGSTNLAVGGTQDTKDYTLSGSVGAGPEQSYTETMSENFDAKAYYKKEPKKDKGGLSIDTEIGGSFDMSNSWTDASTAETKTETSRTVTITRPALETTYGYNFYPELYVTQDGAMKLAYAAEPPAENTPAAEFWENIYGDSWKYGPGKPDAALNLPNRFRPVINSANGYLSGWAVETDEVRQRIRGFFIKEAQPNPETGEYLLLSHELTAGETVRLEVRVYNYTLSEANGHIATPAGAFLRHLARLVQPLQSGGLRPGDWRDIGERPGAARLEGGGDRLDAADEGPRRDDPAVARLRRAGPGQHHRRNLRLGRCQDVLRAAGGSDLRHAADKPGELHRPGTEQHRLPPGFGAQRHPDRQPA